MPNGEKKLLAPLETFLMNLETLGLTVTSQGLKTLGFPEFVEELRAFPPGSKLGSGNSARLRDIIRNIQLTLDSELQARMAFISTKKRMESKKLYENVGGLFAPGVFQELPKLAQYDYEEAAKCVIFERPTAVAFHLLRGTESVLRSFYDSVVKRNRIPRREWGPLVNDLRTKRKLFNENGLLDRLDHIRSNYRNPTQHPEKIYDIDEAQDLWGVCIEVVNRMHQVLKKI